MERTKRNRSSFGLTRASEKEIGITCRNRYGGNELYTRLSDPRHKLTVERRAERKERQGGGKREKRNEEWNNGWRIMNQNDKGGRRMEEKGKEEERKRTRTERDINKNDWKIKG